MYCLHFNLNKIEEKYGKEELEKRFGLDKLTTSELKMKNILSVEKCSEIKRIIENVLFCPKQMLSLQFLPEHTWDFLFNRENKTEKKRIN